MLLAGLLCSGLALALAFESNRLAAGNFGLLVAAAAMGTLLQPTTIAEFNLRIGSSVSIAVTALAVFMPAKMRSQATPLLAANAGLWVSLLASDTPTALLALPHAAASLLLTRLLVQRGYGIFVRILAGWVFAIAILTAALPMITTPGYEPDHME